MVFQVVYKPSKELVTVAVDVDTFSELFCNAQVRCDFDCHGLVTICDGNGNALAEVMKRGSKYEVTRPILET